MLLLLKHAAEGEAQEEVLGDMGGVAELLPVGDPGGGRSVGEQTEKEALHGTGEGPGLLGGLERQEEDQEESKEQKEDFKIVLHLISLTFLFASYILE